MVSVVALVSLASFSLADPLLKQNVTPIAQPTKLSPVERAAIKKAIGKSRVVMLGELTHGDGIAFQLKTAFVKFLHEEMDSTCLFGSQGCVTANRWTVK